MVDSVHIVDAECAVTPSLPARGDLSIGANRLLSAMSPGALALVLRSAVRVELRKGADLIEAGDLIEHCWFPLSGMVSVAAGTPSGSQAAVSIIGSEGFFDCAAVLGDNRSALRATVQIPGQAIRIDAKYIPAAMISDAGFAKLLLAYAQALLIQVADTAQSNGLNTIEARLARLLLMCADRVGSTHIALTHEAVSLMLGVRRSGVTVAIGQLRKIGAVDCARSGIGIIDRQRLEDVAHECYGRPESEYHRLIGKLPVLSDCSSADVLPQRSLYANSTD